MKYILALVFISLQTLSTAQHKYDYYWPTGRASNMAAIDFNSNPPTSEPREGDLWYDRTNASICDKDGQLLFYTNGCRVADSTHMLMPNGDSLNFNLYYTDYIDNCFSGYFAKQGIAILPDPNDSLGYYIIHKPRELEIESIGNWEFSMSNLLYSYVDMRQNQGLGDVTIKNDTILKNKLLQAVHMTAIQHANGRDWWILNPADKINGNTYYRILLDESGFSKIDSQEIGPLLFPDYTLTGNANFIKPPGGGLSRFSPDGTKFAYFNMWDGLHLYDFDRSTGLLSQGEFLDFGWGSDEIWTSSKPWLCSVEFSPNSRFIYLINTFSLYQLDLWEEDLISSLTHIADRDTTILTSLDYFHMMAAGPDCNIYIRGGSSTDHFSVIHEPDLKGVACDFRQNDLKLAGKTGTGNFPYFPRFRVDAEEKCDSNISMVNGLDVFWRRDLDIFPNPVEDRVSIRLPSGRGYLRIVDIHGHIIEQEHVQLLGEQLIHRQTSHWKAGIYFLEYLPEENKHHEIFTTKVVKK